MWVPAPSCLGFAGCEWGLQPQRFLHIVVVEVQSLRWVGVAFLAFIQQTFRLKHNSDHCTSLLSICSNF